MEIRTDWPRDFQVSNVSRLDPLLEEYSDFFSTEVGTFNEYSAKLSVDAKADPKFYKPRAVPYALKKYRYLKLTGLFEFMLTLKLPY